MEPSSECDKLAADNAATIELMTPEEFWDFLQGLINKFANVTYPCIRAILNLINPTLCDEDVQQFMDDDFVELCNSGKITKELIENLFWLQGEIQKYLKQTNWNAVYVAWMQKNPRNNVTNAALNAAIDEAGGSDEIVSMFNPQYFGLDKKAVSATHATKFMQTLESTKQWKSFDKPSERVDVRLLLACRCLRVVSPDALKQKRIDAELAEAKVEAEWRGHGWCSLGQAEDHHEETGCTGKIVEILAPRRPGQTCPNDRCFPNGCPHPNCKTRGKHGRMYGCSTCERGVGIWPEVLDLDSDVTDTDEELDEQPDDEPHKLTDDDEPHKQPEPLTREQMESSQPMLACWAPQDTNASDNCVMPTEPKSEVERQHLKRPRAAVDDVSPDWLPDGWRMEIKITGSIACPRKDKYYYGPGGVRTRSRVETERYIVKATGTAKATGTEFQEL